MKNGVKSEIYYFLLEWKDTNMDEFIDMYGEKRLCEFTPTELHKLHQAILAEQKQEELKAIKKAAIIKDVTNKKIGDRVKTQWNDYGRISAEGDDEHDEPQKVSWVVELDNGKTETWFDEALIKTED